MDRIDPCNIPVVNEHLRSWAAPGEAIKPITIEKMIVADDAIDALVETVRTLTKAVGGTGKVMLVCDRTVMRRGRDELKPLIVDRLSKVVPVDVRYVSEGDGCFHASVEVSRELKAELKSYSAVVSVGSGSVTDAAKYARHLLLEENPSAVLPFIAFPTAASVTAFTSALAVLTVEGVKRTLSSRPPTAVVCDLRTMADAPSIMVQAGFGDVMARSVAYGDYYLANEIGMDDGFSKVPGQLLAWSEQDMLQRAEQVAARELDGVRSVIEAVLLAGMAMSVVNQTAPISGWEHVISHYLDMSAEYDKREQALHGGQVGAATLSSARAYERAWSRLDLDRIASSAAFDVDSAKRRVESLFTKYDTSGAMAGEIWRDYNKKMTRWQQARQARERFVARKRAGEYEAFLRQNVRPSDAVATALARAGAPLRFRELDQPIAYASAHASIQFSHIIRARFTLGDLLDQGGWLNAETAASVLDEG